jgi:adenosylhomocysteine nucleosidase
VAGRRAPVPTFRLDVGAQQGIVMRSGWGKIDAASSTQYAIDRWQPSLVVNLGTCAGIAGQIQAGEVVLVERTIVYDITERMGDSAEAIRSYATDVDLRWLGDGPLPTPARRSIMVSGDQDLPAADVPRLRRLYQAIAVDWESGAIARVAARNGTRVLILRTVSDLVGETSESDVYGRPDVFQERAHGIMRQLFDILPRWLEAALGRSSMLLTGR